MFDNERLINEAQVGLLTMMAGDLPAQRHFSPGAGHGHPPAWILGHLAVAGDTGGALLGAEVMRPEWVGVFGPGSSGVVEPRDEYAAPLLLEHLCASYTRLRDLAANADPQRLARPHGVSVLAKTPFKTVDQVVSLLLTNHFAFHTAQLSSCRREAGFGPVF